MLDVTNSCRCLLFWPVGLRFGDADASGRHVVTFWRHVKLRQVVFHRFYSRKGEGISSIYSREGGTGPIGSDAATPLSIVLPGGFLPRAQVVFHRFYSREGEGIPSILFKRIGGTDPIGSDAAAPLSIVLPGGFFPRAQVVFD